MSIPIVDSHIHLFPASHLPTLSWYTPSSPLGAQHSVSEYRAATSSSYSSPEISKGSSRPATHLRGFIFLETDRISSLSSSNWQNALDEVSLLTRIAKGKPIEGEGHVPEDKDLCLGIVPWAPVPGGPEALKTYMGLVRERTQTEEVWRKIRGVRYLVQDKPAGTMLGEEFINGLKWLEKEGLTFDLGVDARQGGLGQLREAVEMMKRVYSGSDGDGEGGVTVVINHLCKPNLHPPSSPNATHPDFEEWKSLITKMSAFPNTYMKLSGAFTEFPSASTTSQSDIIGTLEPWTNVVFDTFGPGRIMFGSDWPVCNVGGGGNGITWARWRDVVESLLEKKGLDEQAIRGVWGGVAVKAYGVDV